MILRRPYPPLAVDWVGPRSFEPDALKGKVVLLNFWTASRWECIRELPYLARLKERFDGRPFVMVGVHVPEFDLFEEREILVAAMERWDINYPVAMDRDHATWSNFELSQWPAKCLIDRNGVVRYVHQGEGGLRELEAWAIRLLNEMGVQGSMVPVMKDPPVVPSLTLFCGALRSPGIGNEEEGEALTAKDYHDAVPHEPGLFYLEGNWYQDLQFLRLEEDSGHIVVRFEAKEIFAVMSDVNGDIAVSVDGSPLTSDMTGNDVIVEDGRSIVRPRVAGMFHLVGSFMPGEHELRLDIEQRGHRIYSFIMVG